jgi:hypothetical protein
VILAAHTFRQAPGGSLPGLVRRLRARLPVSLPRREPLDPAGAEDALVRALCHDMRGSLTCLESALHHLVAEGASRLDLLAMAQAQAAHLTSMLRTVDASRGTPPQDQSTWRRLRDVVATSVAASGLPRRQLTVRLGGRAGDVLVGDSRLLPRRLGGAGGDSAGGPGRGRRRPPADDPPTRGRHRTRAVVGATTGA